MMLQRRYLKLALEHALERGLFRRDLDVLPDLPFSADEISRRYPAPAKLRLHVGGMEDD